MIRADHSDQVYKTEEAKFRAVVREIQELHEQGQPILVGTTSIEKSELLSKLLLRAGFIRKVAAGIYDYLPLGYKVIRKIENIVREEMNAQGAQEMLMPAILSGFRGGRPFSLTCSPFCTNLTGRPVSRNETFFTFVRSPPIVISFPGQQFAQK
jgi:hypothetical protein